MLQNVSFDCLTGETFIPMECGFRIGPTRVKGCCQTNANSSLQGQWRCPLCRTKVLSDGFELVSAGTVMLPFNPQKVGATQREQQHGLT